MTYNQQYFDATLRHQIDLLRFGSGVARKVNSILDETRADLRKQVEKRLGKATGLDGPGLRRLRELERAIDQTRSPAWNDVTEEWTRTALDVALEEPLFVSGALTSILPVELDLVTPSDGTLRALATTRPFNGKLLKEWADSAQRSDLTRIKQQIRIGMVQGESARDIASRVFGERGAMSITRGQAEAVTRTVISGVSNAAQQEFLADNADLFDSEHLVATLDSRTTPICRAEDGKQYPVGKGPIPPLHVACRSIRVGVIDGQVVGERPFKAGTEQQMLREYGEKHGLGKLKSRDDLPRGSKKDFDAFSRKRMRELTGQVPAHTTYQQWLKGQPAEIQDDILGPARGKLFREGGVTLDQFVNKQGGELTLDEIKERDQEAWRKAGLSNQEVEPAVTKPTAEERARQAEAEAERERARAERAERDRKLAEETALAEADRRRKAEERQRKAEEKQRLAEEAALKRIEQARAKADAEARELAERQRLVAEKEAQELAASTGPKTRAEAIAALKRFVANPLVLDTVKDHEVISAYNTLKSQGVDKIYGGKNPKLQNLVLGAVKSPKLPAHPDGGFNHGELSTLQDEAGGLYSNSSKHGDAYIKIRGDIHDPTSAEWDKVVARRAENRAAIAAFYSNAGKELPTQFAREDGLVPLGNGAEGTTQFQVSVPRGQEFTRILTHEFGHAVHLESVGEYELVDSIVKSAFSDPKRVAVSGYGETNEFEYFAESHTAYYHRREELKAHAPRAYKMVQDVLRLRGIE